MEKHFLKRGDQLLMAQCALTVVELCKEFNIKALSETLISDSCLPSSHEND